MMLPQSAFAICATSASVISRMNCSLMGAFALLIEEWPLNMNAENAGDIFGACRFHGSNCFRQNFRRIGDDGRQHPRRSEFAMGFGDAADSSRWWDYR